MTWKESSACRNIEKCYECGSTQLSIYENDKAACAVCGLVINSNVADSTVERSLGIERQEDSPSHDVKSLSKIARHDNRGEPAKDTTLNGRVQNGLLEMWWRSARVSDETEKKLALAFAEITRIANYLSLPRNVIERASLNYKVIAEKHRIKGRNVRTLSAATTYLASKQCDFAISLDHVAVASGISRRKISRIYRTVLRELNFSVSVKPSHYLPSLLSILPISDKTKQSAVKILEVAENLKLTAGRDPTGMIAAACYISCLLMGERKTQREIAEVTRITETTIRNRYKEIVEHIIFTVAL